MPASHAADAIGFDGDLFDPDPHASAVRATGQVERLIVQRLVARSAETVDRPAFPFPRPARFVHFRQDDIMARRIRFHCPAVGKPALNQLAGFCVVEGVALDDHLGRSHTLPPCARGQWPLPYAAAAAKSMASRIGPRTGTRRDPESLAPA